ncbi:MAG: hypothetical protein HYX68_03690 [Planctomycetes bacterium]|jgi:hypothetical protein|nr:hypothetical protein [Planctomycetota bacterium]
MDNDSLIGLAFGFVCGIAILFAISALVVGTIFKMPFGVNLSAAHCAECEEPAPTVRAPKDRYEMMWGGWTCQECGCKNDKWGRARQGKRRRRQRSREEE